MPTISPDTLFSYYKKCGKKVILLQSSLKEESRLEKLLEKAGMKFDSQEDLANLSENNPCLIFVEDSFWIFDMNFKFPKCWMVFGERVVEEILRSESMNWNGSMVLKSNIYTSRTFYLATPDTELSYVLRLLNASLIDVLPNPVNQLTSLWIILPECANNLASTRHLIGLRLETSNNVLGKDFIKEIKAGRYSYFPGCHPSMLFEGLSFYIPEHLSKSELRGDISFRGGCLVDHLMDGCIIIVDGERKPEESLLTSELLQVDFTKHLVLTSEWLEFSKNLSTLLPSTELYTVDIVSCPHPSECIDQIVNFRIALDNSLKSDDGGLLEQISALLHEHGIESVDRIAGAHVVVAGDIIGDCIPAKHYVTWKCIRQVLNATVPHICDWSHKPLIKASAMFCSLIADTFVLLLDEDKEKTIRKAIELLGGKVRDARSETIEDDDIVVAEEEAAVKSKQFDYVLSNKKVTLVTPHFIKDELETGQAVKEDYVIQKSVWRKWREEYISSFHQQSGSSFHVCGVSNNGIGSMLSEDVTDFNEQEVVSRNSSYEPMEVEGDFQLRNEGFEKLVFVNERTSFDAPLLELLNFSRLIETIKDNMCSLGLEIAEPPLVCHGKYPFSDTTVMMTEVSSIPSPSLKPGHGLVSSYLPSCAKKNLVLAGQFYSSMSECFSWLSRATKHLVKLFESFGLASACIKNRNFETATAVSILVSPGDTVKPQSLIFFKLTTIGENEEVKACVTFSMRFGDLDILRHSLQPSFVAHPQAYILCGQYCVCDKALEIHSKLTIERRPAIRAFMLHDPEEIPELGTPLLLRADLDGFSYRIRKNPLKDGKINELTYNALANLLLECDEVLQTEQYSFVFMCDAHWKSARDRCTNAVLYELYPANSRKCKLCHNPGFLVWDDKNLKCDSLLEEIGESTNFAV